MRKILFTIVLNLIYIFSYGQTQTQNLDMGLHQLQFPSANGGNNRIQSYGGTFPGTWLFKSRYDNIILDAGENENNTYKILFKTGNIERARFSSNGNFGVGTTDPKSPLTIGYNNGANQLAFRRLSGNETFTMNINNTNQILFKNHSGSGDYDFQTNIGGKGVTSALFIKGTKGNIGIGTTDPDSKLTVAGNIHSQEIKVSIKAGADFVFNENYNLPPLQFIEKYVKENNHLPEIASEKEMKENGLLLAEMNIKLLQKVEELTLYIIEQEKRLKKVEEKNINLKLLEERLKKIEEKN